MFGGIFFTGFGSANGWHTETYEFLTGVTSFFDLLFILFDERYVAPGVCPETTGVVVRGFQQFQVAFHGHLVPFFTRNLAGLTTDADGGVGEEPFAFRVLTVGIDELAGFFSEVKQVCLLRDAQVQTMLGVLLFSWSQDHVYT